MKRVLALLALGLLACGPLGAAEGAGPETGYRAEVRVRQPTQFDWELVARSFGPTAARVSSAYDSRAQRYQLFVPPTYKVGQTWPLIVFVSPGDDPLGWRVWRKLCEDNDVLFCAAYGAGNNCPPGRRARVVLDMLDDVRRQYRIDPERTYLVGFGGGAQLAAAVTFALPEAVGGVIAISGAAPPPTLAHQRWRLRDRLSLALVTGTEDFSRREVADYSAGLFADLSVRTRLWVVPKGGHALPPERVLAEAYSWLEDDVRRRRGDALAQPGLAVSAEGIISRRALAARSLALAEVDLRTPDHAYRGVARLEALVARWGGSEAAEKARKLLGEARADARLRAALTEQEAAEERRLLLAQARAQERSGGLAAALQAWQALLKARPAPAEASRAAQEVKRLSALLARAPYLGAAFEGDTTAVQEVVPGGPAYRAGLRRGDRVVRIGGGAVTSLAELRRAFQAHKPGDRLPVEVRRGGATQTFTVLVGSVPLVVSSP